MKKVNTPFPTSYVYEKEVNKAEDLANNSV